MPERVIDQLYRLMHVSSSSSGVHQPRCRQRNGHVDRFAFLVAAHLVMPPVPVALTGPAYRHREIVASETTGINTSLISRTNDVN